MRALITLAAAAAFTVAASAQATPLQLDRGFGLGGAFTSGAADVTAYFDLDVTDPAGITLFQIDHHMNFVAGTVLDYDIRVSLTTGGTFLNNETNAAFWPVDPDVSGTMTSGGAGLPSPGPIPGGLFLPMGQHSMAITYPASNPIFLPNPGTMGAVSNAELAFSGGSFGAPFLGAPFNAPGAFLWQGTFNYFSGNVPVASAVSFGDECPAFNDATFVVDQFNPAAGAPADLTGSSISFAPNGTGGYNVSGDGTGSGFVAPSGAATVLMLGDDALSGPITLTNNVTGPGGVTTNMIEIDSNGRILFDTTANVATVGGPQIGDIVTSVSNVQIGADYDPSMGGTVTVEEIGSDVVVTWDAVPEFGQISTLTTQIVLDAAGNITLRFDNYFPVALSNVGLAQGVGFSDLAPALFATDLSGVIAMPIDTGTNSIGVRADATSLPILGGSLDVQFSQVPATAIGTFLLLGFSNPGLDLTALGAPGCVLRSAGEATLPVANPDLPQVTPIPNLPGLAGLTLFLQGAALDPFAGNPFFISLANGIEATIQAQ
ncbi:MAG: hypothetical protein AAF196_11590 [Planctomycetota bacterium]